MKVYIVVYDGAYGLQIEKVFSNYAIAFSYVKNLDESYYYKILEEDVD